MTEDRQTEVCAKCGNPTINGVCLDCGKAGSDNPEMPTITDMYSFDTQPLDDVSVPIVTGVAGEEVLQPAELIKAAAKEKPAADNPYLHVVPFEKPDFGVNYLRADYVATEHGIPKEYSASDDKEKLIIQKVRINAGLHWYGYWWIMLIALILPWQISWAVGLGLMRFDEKGGRRAGLFTIIMTAAKMLIDVF